MKIKLNKTNLASNHILPVCIDRQNIEAFKLVIYEGNVFANGDTEVDVAQPIHFFLNSFFLNTLVVQRRDICFYFLGNHSNWCGSYLPSK